MWRQSRDPWAVRSRWTCAVLVGILLLGIAPAMAQQVEFAESSDAYFARRVESLSKRTAENIANVTKENWEQLRPQWRQQLQEMLGLMPWPERTELEPTVTGQLQHDGLTIRRLHYQSRPGLYVTANLYLPEGQVPQEGWPAVLYVCGHANVTDEGRLMGNKAGYHHHGLWFARHGVACLMIDTIQLGELHGAHHGTHRLGRWDWVSRGYTPAGVEAWNAIRGIDYLESLDEIDGDHIGLTGRSGGGAYSWFTAALDERIKAAVPVAGITDLENHVVDDCVEGHCDCMYFVNYHGWDYPQLAALVAPRPLLLANSDSDSIFPLDGVIRTHRLLEQLYKRLDAEENYGLLITPGPHRDTQELQVGAFRWLLRHLTGEEPVVARAATKELEPQQLLVFEREIPRDERVTSVSGWFVPVTQPLEDPAEAADKYRRTWADQIRRTALSGWSQEKDAGPLGSQPSWTEVLAGSTSAQQWKVMQVVGASELPFHAVQITGKDQPEGRTVVHIGLAEHFSDLSARGIAVSIEQPEITEAIETSPQAIHLFCIPRESGWNVVTRDGREQTHRLRRYYLLGETAESGQLHDLMTLLAALWDNSDYGSQSMMLAGYRRAAPLAVLAALLSDDSDTAARKIDSLFLQDYPTDPRLGPCLPGWSRICTATDLLAAAQQQMTVRQTTSGKEGTKARKLAADPLDPDVAPQQANGIRIVEVSSDTATIWTRLTRWPVPNLADLPEVQFERRAGKQSRNPILPPDGVAGLAHAVPGFPGSVRIRYRGKGESSWQSTPWRAVDPNADYTAQVCLDSLQPGTAYEVRVEASADGGDTVASTVSGEFATAPTENEHVRLAVGTCQAFVDRDGPHGFELYRTLQDRDVDAFILAGDVVYYDALARSVSLAHYHWQRTYGLPTVVDFHRSVPTYFLKDDHDTYVNDSWPGEHRPWTGDFTFADGQRIFLQQTGSPMPAYRTVRWGKDLQLWLLEGRDERVPNTQQDGPGKTIWGQRQWDWLKETMAASDATYRIIISPTPIVGPDRANKRDNLSNEGFQFEGRKARKFLAEHPNTVVVCGDRHWQYHSVDPETGLHEFSVGPVSDRHAGGWQEDDYRPEIHRFLKVAGGYLEIELDESGDQPRLTLTHRDVSGAERHRHEM